MEEAMMIEAIYGPYAGRRLTVSSADGAQAIKDGWARDPFAPPSDEPPKQLGDKEREAMMAAAETAARKLRGEEEPKAETGEKLKEEKRALDPEPGPRSGYQTRETAKAEKKR